MDVKIFVKVRQYYMSYLSLLNLVVGHVFEKAELWLNFIEVLLVEVSSLLHVVRYFFLHLILNHHICIYKNRANIIRDYFWPSWSILLIYQ